MNGKVKEDDDLGGKAFETYILPVIPHTGFLVNLLSSHIFPVAN